jgi:hypothetical protein
VGRRSSPYGLGCFDGVVDAGCVREAIVTGSGRKQETRAGPARVEHPSSAALIFPQSCPASAGSLSERRRCRVAC